MLWLLNVSARSGERKSPVGKQLLWFVRHPKRVGFRFVRLCYVVMGTLDWLKKVVFQIPKVPGIGPADRNSRSICVAEDLGSRNL